MCKTIPRGKTKHYRVLLFPEARLNIIECFVIPRGKTKHYRVFWCPRGKTKHYRVFWSEQPRGKTKHYRVFWSRHLEELKRKRDFLRFGPNEFVEIGSIQGEVAQLVKALEFRLNAYSCRI
ncbi:unnamed protein product [Rodentolepis nana]|uniref:MBD domain-containing protein n=1 Tax=Rodentolepis nana TaxID=102285 RepID=A0A0R3TEE2_RODNA|nr:unnamed protein product [Rodentolepis nana]